MAKMVLSALLRLRNAGVEAKVAEFPEIQTSAWSIDGALARLRQAVGQKLRWSEVKTNCSGDPISPIPKAPLDDQKLTVPLEVRSAE